MINVALVLVGSVLAAAPCASLKSLAIPGTFITVAELVPAGPYTIYRPDRPIMPEELGIRFR